MLPFKRSGLIRIAGAMAAAGFLGSAQADLVTSWDYSITTKFEGTNTFNTGGGSQTQTERQVSWGAAGGSVFAGNTGDSSLNRSGITISDVDGSGGDDSTVNANTGNVVTNNLSAAGIGEGAWITHHNNVLSGSFATLLTSQIESSLTLWAFPPGDDGGPPDFGPDTLFFTVFFAETSNSEGNCVVVSPVGNPCNDIFALNQSDAFNKSFDYDGEDYFVSIFPIVGSGLGSFNLLGAAACEAAGALADCVGFTTVEGQNTTVQFGFTITADPIELVPEPGSLALAGLGLGLIGLLRRRKA